MGAKLRDANWLRRLGTKKHRDGVEYGGRGADMGGEGGSGEKLNCAPWILTTLRFLMCQTI